MNDLQIFNYTGKQVRTIVQDSNPWWVLKDVCDILGLTNPTVVAERLEEDERSKFDLGRQGEATIINESGLYNVILRSDKPEAKAFKRWITHEVLPSIRKTGTYSIKPDTKQKEIEARYNNSLARKASILLKIANSPTINNRYRQVLQSQATAIVTGKNLLPLPEAEEQTYSAEEIGKMLNPPISANMVGKLANKHNLKTEQYGKYFHDKSRHSCKEVESFRYFESVVSILDSIIKPN